MILLSFTIKLITPQKPLQVTNRLFHPGYLHYKHKKPTCLADVFSWLTLPVFVCCHAATSCDFNTVESILWFTNCI